MSYDRFSDPRHVKWSKAGKDRDNYTCLICRKYGVRLHSHHANSYDWCVEQRFDINNSRTLCEDCHNWFHRIYGKGKNTVYQYNEFVKIYNILKDIAKKQIK